MREYRCVRITLVCLLKWIFSSNIWTESLILEGDGRISINILNPKSTISSLCQHQRRWIPVSVSMSCTITWTHERRLQKVKDVTPGVSVLGEFVQSNTKKKKFKHPLTLLMMWSHLPVRWELLVPFLFLIHFILMIYI